MSGASRRQVLRGAARAALGLTGMPILALRPSFAEAAVRLTLQRIDGGEPAPPFTLPDLDGKPVRFADFKNKVVVVNFWATWCPPCRQEIPSMERAWKRLKDEDVALLAIHVGGDMDKIWAFANEFNISFPVLVDTSSKVSREWRTIGLPTTFVVAPDGRKALRAIGDREWDHPAILGEILSLRTAKNQP